MDDLLDNLSSLGDISNAYNANQCMTDFINTFKTTLDTHAQLRKQTRKEKKKKIKAMDNKGTFNVDKEQKYIVCTIAQCIKEQNQTLWKEFKKY